MQGSDLRIHEQPEDAPDSKNVSKPAVASVLWDGPSPFVVCRAWHKESGAGDRVEKSHDNPPKRCNSTRPIGNRPQVGNPPHMQTAIFHEVSRAAGPLQQTTKTDRLSHSETLCYRAATVREWSFSLDSEGA